MCWWERYGAPKWRAAARRPPAAAVSGSALACSMRGRRSDESVEKELAGVHGDLPGDDSDRGVWALGRFDKDAADDLPGYDVVSNRPSPVRTTSAVAIASDRPLSRDR